MNEDFISSSMETGIRLPIGDAGGPGGDPAFPSTLSIGGGQLIKSPTASHDCPGPPARPQDSQPATFQSSPVVADITVRAARSGRTPLGVSVAHPHSRPKM